MPGTKKAKKSSKKGPAPLLASEIEDDLLAISSVLNSIESEKAMEAEKRRVFKYIESGHDINYKLLHACIKNKYAVELLLKFHADPTVREQSEDSNSDEKPKKGGKKEGKKEEKKPEKKSDKKSDKKENSPKSGNEDVSSEKKHLYEYGGTPLHAAIRHHFNVEPFLSHPRISELMAIKDGLLRSPMMVAVQCNNTDFVKKVIELQIQVDWKETDSNGKSLLFHAVVLGNLEIFNLIKSNIPSIENALKDKLGKNAIEIAKTSKFCQKLLDEMRN
jgi:hypothetical protein